MDEQEILKEFSEKYNALCKEYGRQIIGVPTWVMTNHGTYELTIKMQLAKIEEEKSKI